VLPSLLALGITAQASGLSALRFHSVAILNPIQVENRKPGTTDWLLTKVEEIRVSSGSRGTCSRG